MSSAGRVIFVGNIPYDMAEEQVIDIFRQSGPVKSFRLVMDPETGRAKGYGFCEYYDPETAASAVRNLADYSIGTRKLRVQLSQNQGGGRTAVDPPPNRSSQMGSTQQQQPYSGTPQGTQTSNSMLPPLPAGTAAPAGASIPDTIAKTLSSFQPHQLLDILSQLKAVVHSEPEQARQLLETNPQLSYTVLQALLMMKLVDPAVLHTVVTATSQSMVNATPGFPSQPPQAPQRPASAAQDPQKAALIAQVMALTDDQINALGPNERAQIIQLKQSIAMGTI